MLDRRYWHIWLILITTLLAGIWWWAHPPLIPYITPDSGSYLRFDSTRTTGYPLLLNLMHSISEAEWWLKAVQLASMLLAFGWFAFEASRFFQAKWVALPIQLALVFNPLLMHNAFVVMTEAFFITFFALWLVAVLRVLSSTGKAWLVFAAFCFASLWLLKTLSLVWFPVLIFMLLWIAKKQGWRSGMFAAFLFVLVVVVIKGSGDVYRHSHVSPVERGFFLGSQLLGKMAFIPVAAEQTSNPAAASRLNALMEDARKIRAALPDYRQRFIFSVNFYDYVRFLRDDDIIVSTEETKFAEDYAKQLSVSMMKVNSLSYLDEVGMTVVAMWSMGELQTRQFAENYNKLLDAATPSLAADINLYRPAGRSAIVVYVMKAFMLVAFLMSLWFIIRFIFVKQSDLDGTQQTMIFALFLISLAIHAYIVGVSLFQTALIRYIVAIWPLLVLLVFGGGVFIMRSFLLEILDSD